MPRRADVTSIDALEAFRAKLVVYRTEARLALDEVHEEVVRTRLWLQNDQRTRWESRARHLKKDLDEAQQDCFSARLSSFRRSGEAERTVARLKRALREAEEKLKVLAQAVRHYESRVEPLAKRLDGLSNLLADEMPKAIAYLAQRITSLHEYTDTAPGGDVS